VVLLVHHDADRFLLVQGDAARAFEHRRQLAADELPLDQEGFVINVRFPLPSAECDGRPGEAACTKSSLGD